MPSKVVGMRHHLFVDLPCKVMAERYIMNIEKKDWQNENQDVQGG